MKITILQRNIVWADAQANRERVDEAMASLPHTDLLVLPEMFTTGFCMRPEEMAEPCDGETLRWMQRKASEHHVALTGSVAVCEGGRYYNRLYFVHPNGRVQHYDKKHLFTYGGEQLHFTPGTERVVVTCGGVRILLGVCYDLRFPVWSRNRGDYDLMLYVASWPTRRQEAWNVLLRARAIENQCYVVGVNRVGSDASGDYSGGSVIINPYGQTLAACADGIESTATAEIDLEALEHFRRKFPVAGDADCFQLLG